MRELLLSLVCVFALLFSACSKEEAPRPAEEKKYAVTFKVNGLSHDMVPMAGLNPGPLVAAAGSGGLPEGIAYLNYIVFNSDGYQIADKTISRGTAGFEPIKDFYARGKYKVWVLGRRHMGFGSPMYYDDFAYVRSYELGDEVFFKQFDLEVSDKDIEQEIELKRKVGKVEIQLTGKVPQNLWWISYSISGVSEYFSPKTNRGDNTRPITRTYYVNASIPTEEMLAKGELHFFFFLDEDKDTKAKITMTAYDYSYSIIAQKEIENVPVGVNKKTILRGQLFGSDGKAAGQAFSVSH